MNINFLKPSHNKAKAVRRGLLLSTLFGLTLGGLLLSSNIKEETYKGVEAATSDVKYMPTVEYYFHENNPGWDDTVSDVNTRNYLTAAPPSSQPTGTGQNGVPGIVEFDGASQYLASAKLNSNTNNPFQKNPNSSFTIAFDIEFTSIPDNWMFPITFYQGGDVYALTKGHAGFVVDNGDGGHTLMYLDKAADGESGGWWGGAITKIQANTVYSIVITINQSGNTKVYLNGSSTPIYDKATNFTNYARSGSDWSVFSLGGIPWTKGSYELADDWGGMGFAPCKFKYLQVYVGTIVPAGCAAQFKTRHYIPKAYTLTYDTNGGSSISSETYYASTTDYTYTLSSSTTKTGFDFNGYSIKTQTSGANCTVSGTTLTVKANAYGNLAVRANWTATPVSFTPGSGVATFSTSSQSLTPFAEATCATGGGYTYTITGGNTGEYFSIDSSTRVVSVSGSTPVGTYPLTLRATNNSSGGYSEGTYTVTINKKSTIVTAPTAKVLTFTGSTQQLVNAGDGEGVSFTYSLSSGSGYSSTIPSGTNSGTYTVYWIATVNSNYSTTSATSGSVSVTIATKDDAYIEFAENSVTKSVGDSAFTNTLTNTGDGTVTYSSDNTTVATVNSSNGEVTILSCDGVNSTVHITATVTDTSNSTYDVKSVSYTLLVTNMGTYDGNMLFRKYYNCPAGDYDWNTGGAKTAVYYWDGQGHSCWSNIAEEGDKYVSHSGSGYDGYNDYFVNPSDTTYKWTNFKFVRLKNTCTVPSFEEAWFQGADMSINSGYNCYGPKWNNNSTESNFNWLTIEGITYYDYDTHIYLDMNEQASNWKNNNAVIGAYFFGSNNHTDVSTVQMKMVKGFENEDHSENTALFEVVVPEGNYTNVIFFRNESLTINNAWNQTSDLHRYANNVYKLYDMTSGTHDWNMTDESRACCYGRYFNECIVCTGESVDPDHMDWSSAKTEYLTLASPVKKIIKGATANPSGNDYQKAVSKYDDIVFRRRYSWADDFMSRNDNDGTSGSVYKGTLGSNNNNFNLFFSNDVGIDVILIIVVSSISIISISCLSIVIIKKRKKGYE